MAEQYTLVEERRFSNRGLFIYAFTDEIRDVWLRCRVLREPLTNYRNKDHSREPSVYANIEWELEGQIQRKDRMDYLGQDFYWSTAVDGGYGHPAIVCAFQSIFDDLALIKTALGIPTIPSPEVFLFSPLQRRFDKILFDCREDTAIVASLYVRKHESLICGIQEPFPPSPALPNLPVPPVLPGEWFLPGSPNAPSPPYTPPNDGGDTAPFAEDSIGSPPGYPQGSTCQVYLVNYTFQADAGIDPLTGGGTIPIFAELYSAPYLQVSIDPVTLIETLILFADCRGIQLPGFPPCGVRALYEINLVGTGFGPANLQGTITSVVPQ